MKILVAEDDVDLLDVTVYALRKQGYNVSTATDGTQAVERWRAEQPDLMVLDLGLPRLSGIEVCRRVRETSATPVIMMSGKGDDENVVQGFLVGADDYVVKPFSHRQLAMRIRAVLNRAAQKLEAEPTGLLKAGDLCLDLQSHEVTKGDLTVRLTPLEFRILYILAANEGRVVSSTRLIEYAWGYDGGEASLLKTHVCHIRRKLGVSRGQPGDIVAIPWVGYKLLR
ncbi:MAG TPA: response regulator transcription factor [Chloroflexota bacterium]|jgi:DNA-binding response OmpR family regulator|nr:response regulator transcription factor [Chloroflexota bacterium]